MKPKRKLKKVLCGFLIILMIFIETGCTSSNTYRISRTDYSADGKDTFGNLIIYHVNYYFVHIDDKVIQLNNLNFSKQNETITGQEVELNQKAYAAYQNVNRSGEKTHINGFSHSDVEQLHFFVYKINDDEEGFISFTKENVIKTHVLKISDDNEVKSGNVIVGVGAGIIVGIIGGAILLKKVLENSCSCPHIYTSDGTNYNRNSNAFVGSVSKVLEKEDIAVVNFGDSKSLNVNIVNEEDKETQFINEAKLIQVSHDKQVQILPDQNGNLYTLSDKKVALNGEIKGLSEKGDNLSYEFEEISKYSDLSELELTFPIAKGTDKAKLVLTTKNTYWASYVMQEWYKLFGSDIDKIKAKNAKRGAEEQLNWQKDQGISLSVFVKSNGEWVFQEAIGVVGNTVSRDIIVPLSNLDAGSEILEVKLVSGYKLWDVDYVAVDYSDESKIEVREIAPNISNLTNNTFKSDQISLKDESYATLNYGDTLSLSFNGEIGEGGKEITHLLKLSGYYVKESNQTGELKRRELASFRHKAQMSRYSFHLMKNLNEGLVLK